MEILDGGPCPGCGNTMGLVGPGGCDCRAEKVTPKGTKSETEELTLATVSVVSRIGNVYLIGLDEDGKVWEKEVTAKAWRPHAMLKSRS